MAIEQLTKNVEIIQTLSDYPNTDNGLTPAELKRKFDEGSRVIKEYLNATIVPAINDPHPTGLRMNYKPITAVSSLNYSKGDQDTDITVQPGFSYEEGRYLRHEDYEGEPIILRGVAPGVKETDAVNLGQLQDKTRPLTVTIDVDHSIASYTAGNILAAYEAGQDVRGILRESDGHEIRLSLLSVDAYNAIFVRFSDDNSWEKYLVTAIGAVEYYSEYYALADYVENAIRRLGPLIVTVDEGTEFANHTSYEIQAHSEAGGDVYLAIDSCLVPLSWVDINNIAFFERYVPADKLKVSYLVWDDGTIEKISTQIATAEDLSTAIQNSEKETINKLCPSFSESGSMVRCEPVEGYPLSVTVEEGATIISRCGKNLIDYTQAVPRTTGNVVNIIENGVEWAVGSHYFKIPCNIKAGSVVAFSCVDESGTIDGATLYNSVTKSACSDMSRNGKGVTATADADVVYVYKENPSTQITTPIVITNLQLECGTVATAYEPYKGIKTFEHSETILGASGVNTIWADSGEIAVTGKADPVAIINKLTNAIISLGSNL